MGSVFVENNSKVHLVPSNYLVKFRIYSEGFSELFDGWSKSIAIRLFTASPSTVLGILGFVGFTVNIVFLRFFYIFWFFMGNIFLILHLVFLIIFIFVSSKIGNFGRYFLLHPIFGESFVFFEITFLKVRKGGMV